MFLRGQQGFTAAAWSRFIQQQKVLEQTLELPIGEPGFPFLKRRPTSVHDDRDLAAAIDWLLMETDRYVRTARHYLQMDSF